MRVENTLYIMSHVAPQFIKDLQIFNIIYIVAAIVLVIKDTWFKSAATQMRQSITVVSEESMTDHDGVSKDFEELKNEFNKLKSSIELNRRSLTEMYRELEQYKVITLKLGKDLGKD